MKRKIFEVLWVIAAAVLIFCMMYVIPSRAHAKAIAGVEAGNVSIVLTDEPCALAAVTNLPYRSTWTENGKTVEGCYGVHPAGVVLSYWADRTVSVMPVDALHPLTGV